jgi:hypothetical protein
MDAVSFAVVTLNDESALCLLLTKVHINNNNTIGYRSKFGYFPSVDINA